MPALRKAPLVVLFVLLTTCRFDFNLIEPSIEVSGQTAYQSGNKFYIDYKFIADEPSLRCKYIVSFAGVLLLQGATDDSPPRTWQHLEIELDQDPEKGKYIVQLMAQAPRGDAFIDLAFLTKTYDFYLDGDNPIVPDFIPEGCLLNDTRYVTLTHKEWNDPKGSPVSVYYTTDPAAPSSSFKLYIAGSSIRIELSETPTELRAIAIDDSGRESPIKSDTYRFINIESTKSTSNMLEENVFITGLEDQFIYVHGYGFAAGFSAVFLDADSTPATIMGTSYDSPTEVTVVVRIDNEYFTDNGTVNEGILRLIDVSGVTDEIRIDLRP